MIDQCPNCNAELELAKCHSYHDWAIEFQINCPKCEIVLDVRVETKPVFYVTEEQEDDG